MFTATYHPFRFEHAMTSLRFTLFCALAVVTAGCEKEATFVEPIPPQAALHWVQAVPDTGAIDMRPIDIITNAALMDAPFRASNMFYQGIDAGTRRIRAFMDGTDPAITGVPILDTTVTLAANASYTLIHTGFARVGSSPGRVLWIVPDTPTDPGANQVSVRVAHAGVGMANVDVNISRHAADTLPDVPLIGNAAYQSVSTYRVFGYDSVGADSLRVVVTAAGTKTPVLLTIKLPSGTPGTTTSNPIPGMRVPRSAFTAVLLPPSVVGSAAPQGGAFAAPGAVFLADRRPSNTIP